jgi:hypothetical protein
VYARVYSAAGAPLTDEFAVDTAAGDCSSPEVAALPDGSFTIVWNQRDMVVTTNVQVNTTTASKQIHPTVAWNGVDRFVVVWTSFVGKSGFDLYGQAYTLNQ